LAHKTMAKVTKEETKNWSCQWSAYMLELLSGREAIGIPKGMQQKL
jgi:hypothetical protein